MLGAMTAPPALLDLVRCPACHGALEAADDAALRCAACALDFPVQAGVPWLFRDVEGARAQWAAKLQRFRRGLLTELEALDRALERDDVVASTRERLRRQRAGREAFGEQVFALLAPFALREGEAGATLPRDRIPSGQHVTSYLETAHRDWRWGEPELEATRRLIAPAVSRLEGDVLVLGGGAGRLAFDLALARPEARIVQLDVNPLLTRIAAAVVAGEEVALNELPELPLSVEDACVEQRLARPDDAEPKAPPVFLLGDVFAPPFAPASFDALVTPWVVDILPEPFARLVRRLGGLLRPGGRWLGFGPTSFEAHGPADRLTPEEMADVLEAAGFALETAGTETVPYLHSPHGMPRRGEEIFVFEAMRPATLDAVDDFAFYPEWLLDPRQPIPADPRFETLRAERTFDVEILKCIDGRSSIEDLVVILSSRFGLAPAPCRATIERFFARQVEGGQGADGAR